MAKAVVNTPINKWVHIYRSKKISRFSSGPPRDLSVEVRENSKTSMKENHHEEHTTADFYNFVQSGYQMDIMINSDIA